MPLTGAYEGWDAWFVMSPAEYYRDNDGNYWREYHDESGVKLTTYEVDPQKHIFIVVDKHGHAVTANYQSSKLGLQPFWMEDRERDRILPTDTVLQYYDYTPKRESYPPGAEDMQAHFPMPMSIGRFKYEEHIFALYNITTKDFIKTTSREIHGLILHCRWYELLDYYPKTRIQSFFPLSDEVPEYCDYSPLEHNQTKVDMYMSERGKYIVTDKQRAEAAMRHLREGVANVTNISAEHTAEIENLNIEIEDLKQMVYSLNNTVFQLYSMIQKEHPAVEGEEGEGEGRKKRDRGL